MMRFLARLVRLETKQAADERALRERVRAHWAAATPAEQATALFRTVGDPRLHPRLALMPPAELTVLAAQYDAWRLTDAA